MNNVKTILIAAGILSIIATSPQAWATKNNHPQLQGYKCTPAGTPDGTVQFVPVNGHQFLELITPQFGNTNVGAQILNLRNRPFKNLQFDMTGCDANNGPIIFVTAITSTGVRMTRFVFCTAGVQTDIGNGYVHVFLTPQDFGFTGPVTLERLVFETYPATDQPYDSKTGNIIINDVIGVNQLMHLIPGNFCPQDIPLMPPGGGCG